MNHCNSTSLSCVRIVLKCGFHNIHSCYHNVEDKDAHIILTFIFLVPSGILHAVLNTNHSIYMFCILTDHYYNCKRVDNQMS